MFVYIYVYTYTYICIHIYIRVYIENFCTRVDIFPITIHAYIKKIYFLKSRRRSSILVRILSNSPHPYSLSSFPYFPLKKLKKRWRNFYDRATPFSRLETFSKLSLGRKNIQFSKTNLRDSFDDSINDSSLQGSPMYIYIYIYLRTYVLALRNNLNDP